MKRIFSVALTTILACLCSLNLAHAAAFGVEEGIENAQAAISAAQVQAHSWCGFNPGATIPFNQASNTAARLSAINVAIQKCQGASAPVRAQLAIWAQSCTNVTNATQFAACAVNYMCLKVPATGQPCFTTNINNTPACITKTNTYFSGSSSNVDFIGNACSSCPSSAPYLNPTTLACQPKACTGATPYFNQVAQACQACPATTPVFNATTQSCSACPQNMPVYQASTNSCTFQHWCGYDPTATINWNTNDFSTRANALTQAVARCESVQPSNPSLLVQLVGWANTCKQANGITVGFATIPLSLPQVKDACRGAYTCLSNQTTGATCFMPNEDNQTCTAYSGTYNPALKACSGSPIGSTVPVMTTPPVGHILTPATGTPASAPGTTTGTTSGTTAGTAPTPSVGTPVSAPTSNVLTPVTEPAPIPATPATTTGTTPMVSPAVAPPMIGGSVSAPAPAPAPATGTGTGTGTTSATTAAPAAATTPTGPTPSSCLHVFGPVTQIHNDVQQLNLDLSRCGVGCYAPNIHKQLDPRVACCKVLTGNDTCDQ